MTISKEDVFVELRKGAGNSRDWGPARRVESILPSGKIRLEGVDKPLTPDQHGQYLQSPGKRGKLFQRLTPAIEREVQAAQARNALSERIGDLARTLESMLCDGRQEALKEILEDTELRVRRH